VPELDGLFRLVIRPAESRYIFASARIVWSDTLSNDKSMPHAMGVRFERTPSF
jgi:hypothetical protein